MLSYVTIFKLSKHIEGGYFGLFYTSEDKVTPLSNRYLNNKTTTISTSPEAQIETYTIKRSALSSIYFLLERNDYSAWHRLKSDEIWHYYDGGSTIDIHVIDQDGNLNLYPLGNPDMGDNASFHVVIKAGSWFAAEVRDKSSFGFVGCTVSPGFEYDDFELAERTQLTSLYPELIHVIDKFIHSNAVHSEEGSLMNHRIERSSKLTSSFYKNKLNLEKHIEGGYFNVSYTSNDMVYPLNPRYKKQTQIIKDSKQESTLEQRCAASFIYFLLENNDFSAWHRLKSDEIWHYYDGCSPIDIHLINQDGKLTTLTLGNPRSTDSASFQVVIPAGTWFSAEVRDKVAFGLVGCTVSPGFEYQDFELANRKSLLSQFPQHSKIISKFTRSTPAEIKTWTSHAMKYAVVALVAGIGLFSVIKDNTLFNECSNNIRNRLGI